MTVEKAITELKRVADLCSITPLAEAAIMGAEALKYKLELENNNAHIKNGIENIETNS